MPASQAKKGTWKVKMLLTCAQTKLAPTHMAKKRHSLHSITRMRSRQKKRTRLSGYWIGAKEDTSDKIVECVLICQLLFPSSSCSSFCQNSTHRRGGGEEGEPRTLALQRSPKLLTLISLRALQLRHGIIFAVTLIDWCQRPLVLLSNEL